MQPTAVPKMRCNAGEKVGIKGFVEDAGMLVVAAVRMKAAGLNADRTGQDRISQLGFCR